jgi:hypothetical protein
MASQRSAGAGQPTLWLSPMEPALVLKSSCPGFDAHRRRQAQRGITAAGRPIDRSFAECRGQAALIYRDDATRGAGLSADDALGGRCRTPVVARPTRDPGEAGDLQEIRFAGITPAEDDIYQVKFDNGSIEWRIDLTQDGKIRRIALGPQRRDTQGSRRLFPPALAAVPVRTAAIRRSDCALPKSQAVVEDAGYERGPTDENSILPSFAFCNYSDRLLQRATKRRCTRGRRLSITNVDTATSPASDVRQQLCLRSRVRPYCPNCCGYRSRRWPLVRRLGASRTPASPAQ